MRKHFLFLLLILLQSFCSADLENIGDTGDYFDTIDLKLRYESFYIARCTGISPCVSYLTASPDGLNTISGQCTGTFEKDRLCEYSPDFGDPNEITGICEIPSDGFMKVEFYLRADFLNTIDAETTCKDSGSRWISWTDI